MIDQNPRNPWTKVLVAAMLCLPVSAAVSPPAFAFFQTTQLEGTIPPGSEGVWLAVSRTMPTFRVRLDRGEDRVAPFDVGPIPDSLAPLFPTGLNGVIITKFDDPTVADRIGVFEGDVIIKVNTVEVSNVEEYEAALKDVKSFFLLTIQRTKLVNSSARIVKIKAETEQVEENGATVLGEQKVTVWFSDAVLPFADEVEAARKARSAFTPSPEAVKSLKNDWWTLPDASPPTFVSGEHRVVAAPDYDAALRQDPNLRGTQFTVVSTLNGNPLTGAGGKAIVVQGIRDIGAERMTGSIVESTVATAPFPISIEFDGSFTMYKLGDYSNKDIEYRAELANKAATEDAEDGNAVELAPDIPESIPASNSEITEPLAE